MNKWLEGKDELVFVEIRNTQAKFKGDLLGCLFEVPFWGALLGCPFGGELLG